LLAWQKAWHHGLGPRLHTGLNQVQLINNNICIGAQKIYKSTYDVLCRASFPFVRSNVLPRRFRGAHLSGGAGSCTDCAMCLFRGPVCSICPSRIGHLPCLLFLLRALGRICTLVHRLVAFAVVEDRHQSWRVRQRCMPAQFHVSTSWIKRQSCAELVPAV
jgi:hypothetical protein